MDNLMQGRDYIEYTPSVVSVDPVRTVCDAGVRTNNGYVSFYAYVEITFSAMLRLMNSSSFMKEGYSLLCGNICHALNIRIYPPDKTLPIMIIDEKDAVKVVQPLCLEAADILRKETLVARHFEDIDVADAKRMISALVSTVDTLLKITQDMYAHVASRTRLPGAEAVKIKVVLDNMRSSVKPEVDP